VGVALPQALPGGDEDLERARLGLDGLLDHAAQETLVGPPLEQRRTCRGLGAARLPQGGAEVRGGLPVSAQPRRPIPRRLRVFEHDGAVAGRFGVMRQPRRIGAPHEGGQRRPVQRDVPVGRERVLDRRARDLVPKADRVPLGAQHPGRQARLQLG
jgi:hypothetical protein